MISYYNQIGQITSYYLYHQKRTKLYCRLKECNLFPSYFRSYFKCLLESLSACIFVSMLCVNTVCLYLCISKSVGLSFLCLFFVYPSSSFVSACMDCLSFFNYQVYLKKIKINTQAHQKDYRIRAYVTPNYILTRLLGRPVQREQKFLNESTLLLLKIKVIKNGS